MYYNDVLLCYGISARELHYGAVVEIEAMAEKREDS